MTAHSINLINKYDTRSVFLSIFEEIPHPGSPNSYKHFHKVGPANREKRYSGFTRYRFGHQGFTCAWRTIKQYSAGNLSPHLNKFLRGFKKLHYFSHFFFGLFNSGHIRKGGLGIFPGRETGLTLAKLHNLIAPALGLVHYKEQYHDKYNNRKKCGQ